MPQFETLLTKECIERNTSSGWWPDRLLIDYLDAAASARPDKVAIIDSHRSLTYGALRELVDRCARGFLSLGLKPGDVISIQLPNWIEFAAAYLAASRIGLVACLITPIHRDREVAQMLNLAEAKLALVPGVFRGFDYPAMLKRLRPHVATLQHVIVVGADCEGASTWDSLVSQQWQASISAQSLERYRPEPNSVTEIVFTSGTSGEPKGVLHTHNTALAPQLAMGRSLRLHGDSVLHVTSTMAHQTGFLGGIVLPILWGAAIVYQEQWDPEAFVELIARHKIEVTNGNATFLLDVLRARNLAHHDVSSFKIFRAGGGPIRTVLINEAREKLPGVTILRGWGQSENGVVTMTQLGDPPELLANSDGRAQAGMSVQIVDPLNQPLPPGVEGRLQCKGAFQFAGYLKQADVTRASYVGDWFETGDLAIKLDDRYIRITGRSKDVIIRGGEKIPVKYVEDVLHEDERVADAAIVAMPDSRLGEKACAFVICRPHSMLSLQEMQRFLEQKGVAKQYWPERLEICSELPRAANGKIRKAELRTRISAAIGREQSVPVPAPS